MVLIVERRSSGQNGTMFECVLTWNNKGKIEWMLVNLVTFSSDDWLPLWVSTLLPLWPLQFQIAKLQIWNLYERGKNVISYLLMLRMNSKWNEWIYLLVWIFLGLQYTAWFRLLIGGLLSNLHIHTLLHPLKNPVKIQNYKNRKFDWLIPFIHSFIPSMHAY